MMTMILDSIDGSDQNNETVKGYDKEVTLKAPTDWFLQKSNLTNLKNEDGQYDAKDENEEESREMSTMTILVEYNQNAF